MEAPPKPYANITKSFVPLAAQICFMKNCWNPSPMTAITGPCTRHYHPTLSIWLSVDPMSDKYPGVSPYVYCGNNPVVLKDPDGREFGDYFNFRGRYLGTDGSGDENVYIITNNADIRTIKRNNKSGKSTATSSVHIKVSTTKCVLEKTNDVFSRLENNNGFCEEGASVFPDGYSIDYERGPDARYTDDGKGHITLPDGYERDGSGTLIHGHPLGETTERYWPVTTKLDNADATAAKENSMSIVVGMTKKDDFGMRRKVVYFFDNTAKFIGGISRGALTRINNIYNVK